jgi:hypothetical protein
MIILVVRWMRLELRDNQITRKCPKESVSYRFYETIETTEIAENRLQCTSGVHHPWILKGLLKCIAEASMSLRSIFIVLCLALTASPANAKIQLYSTFSTNGVPAQECIAASAIVRPLIAQFGSPADWTWIIVCDEPAWHRVEQHIGQQDSVGGLTLGTTDLENRVTYIRGYYVLHPRDDRAEAQPDHTIAHELGHITLNTHNEDKAERKAGELLRSSALPVVVMVGEAK